MTLCLLFRWCAAALLGSALLTSSRAAELPDVIERIKPSIVAVGTFQKTRNPSFKFLGTGFAVGDGRQIATNAHVLPTGLNDEQREALVVMARSADGGDLLVRPASVIATDEEHDAALLGVEGTPLPALELSTSGAVREGQHFAFTGYPLGNALGLFPVTHRALVASVAPIALPGISSRKLDAKLVRRLKGPSFRVLQLDATAYPGSSGSPLYNEATGEVVGVLNMVFVKGSREAALSKPSGISFAIPIQHVQQLLRQQR